MSLVELTKEEKKKQEQKQKDLDMLFKVPERKSNDHCRICGAKWQPYAKYCIKCGKKKI